MTGKLKRGVLGLLAGSFLVLTMINPIGAIGPDARSLGMGGASTAVADGAAAVYWNPANLALNPRKFTLLTGLGIEANNNALTGGDLQRLMSGADVSEFRSQLETEGLELNAQGVGEVSLSFGSLAFAGVPLAFAQATTDNDFWKVFFLIMEEEAPDPGIYSGTGNVNGCLLTAYTLSYARKLPLPGLFPLAVGISGKWLSGLSYGDITGNVNFTFPGIPDPVQNYYITKSANSGSGLAVDLGLGAKLTSLIQVGLVFENLTSSMQWSGTTTTERITGFDPITGKPITTKTEVAETYQTGLPPVTRLGIAFRPPILGLTLAGDIRMASGQTTYHLGLEWPLWILALRAGYATDPSGTGMFSAGLGLRLLAFHLDFAVASPTITDYTTAKAAKLALSGGLQF